MANLTNMHKVQTAFIFTIMGIFSINARETLLKVAKTLKPGDICFPSKEKCTGCDGPNEGLF